MSRIGKQPIKLPQGVTVTLKDNVLIVQGQKGTLQRPFFSELDLVISDQAVEVTRKKDAKRHKSLHGLMRTLLANMIQGVTEGFAKTLQMQGVGYRAEMKGKQLVIRAGFSHPVPIDPPEGISFALAEEGRIAISGVSKELVGQVASNIRRLRPPEPYKGKGIYYIVNGKQEKIIRKEGKRGAS